MWTKILWLIKTNWKTTIAGWLLAGVLYAANDWFGMVLTEEQIIGISAFIAILGT